MQYDGSWCNDSSKTSKKSVKIQSKHYKTFKSNKCNSKTYVIRLQNRSEYASLIKKIPDRLPE